MQTPSTTTGWWISAITTSQVERERESGTEEGYSKRGHKIHFKVISTHDRKRQKGISIVHKLNCTHTPHLTSPQTTPVQSSHCSRTPTPTLHPSRPSPVKALAHLTLCYCYLFAAVDCLRSRSSTTVLAGPFQKGNCKFVLLLLGVNASVIVW